MSLQGNTRLPWKELKEKKKKVVLSLYGSVCSGRGAAFSSRRGHLTLRSAADRSPSEKKKIAQELEDTRIFSKFLQNYDYFVIGS
jgi:hypothetical protein